VTLTFIEQFSLACTCGWKAEVEYSWLEVDVYRAIIGALAISALGLEESRMGIVLVGRRSSECKDKR
jgi:hypothetical protein